MVGEGPSIKAVRAGRDPINVDRERFHGVSLGG